MAVIIKYNGIDTELFEGKMATLHCKDKNMLSNIEILNNDSIKATINYNGVTTDLPEGTMATLLCKDKNMLSNIEITYPETTIALVTFEISEDSDGNGGIYQAEEDMTWGEWVESKYNTDGYYLRDDYVGTPDGQELVSSITASDLIIANEFYSTEGW